MQPVLIAAPTDPVLTLAEAKRHLRIDFDDDDDLIAEMVAAVSANLDPAFGGWLGRALRPQSWELQLSDFYAHRRCWPRWGHGAIELPFPPLLSITSVTYDDVFGVAQTLDKDVDFRVLNIGGRGKQAVAPLYNGQWPPARVDHASVRIRFQCGYPVAVVADPQAFPPVAAVPDSMPSSLKAWVKLVVGSLNENRESMIAGERAAVAELPPHIMELVKPHQIFT